MNQGHVESVIPITRFNTVAVNPDVMDILIVYCTCQMNYGHVFVLSERDVAAW